jgi:Golgi nucleoside diphosphatase
MLDNDNISIGTDLDNNVYFLSLSHSISNPIESEKILKEVGSKLHTYPFDFRGATILSGPEEGAYGWVTVNYLLENFIKVKLQSPHQSHSSQLRNKC